MNIEKISTQFGATHRRWRIVLLAVVVMLALPQIEHHRQSIGAGAVPHFTITAAPAIQTNRSLIKTSSSSTVYWLQNNRIYGIINGNIVTTMQNAGVPGWNWSSIFTVSSIASYTRGPDFISTSTSSNGLLVKRYQDSAVYLITNGRKEFLSYEEFVRRGFSFDNVIDVAQAILNTFPTAPAPNFTISASPSSRTVTQGQSAVYTITVQNLNGFNSGVILSAVNLPGGGFSPQTVVPPPNGSANSTLTIVTNGQTPTGGSTITIQGRGNGITKSMTVNLTVNRAGDTTSPTVSAFNVSTPRALVEGLAFTISYTVSDAGGLNRVELWRASEGNNGQRDDSTWREIKRNSHSGIGTLNSSFTDAPASGGKYWYGIHVFDNAGNQRNEPAPPGPIEVQVYREPVILVHGRHGNPRSFGQMEQLLEGITTPGKRFRVFSFDYYDERYPDAPQPAIEIVGGRLKDCINVILRKPNRPNEPPPRYCNGLQLTDAELKEMRGAAKVHIVAHSMGGLVTRTYISNIAHREGSATTVSFENDVDRFITLASPHFGTVWALFGSATDTQVLQMRYASSFLWNLQRAWSSSSYSQTQQSKMLTVVGLYDTVVPDRASATYSRGSAVRAIYVYKGHNNDRFDPRPYDGVANVDPCHVSYHLVQSSLTGKNIALSGSVSCISPPGSPPGRDERWTYESNKNEGSLLLRAMYEGTNSPVQVLSVNLPGKHYPDPEGNAGTWQVTSVPPGNYQLTVAVSPSLIIPQTVAISHGRTTVLNLPVRASALAQQLGSSAPLAASSTPFNSKATTASNLSGYLSRLSLITTTTSTISTVSAASFADAPLAPESIASVFGAKLATTTEIAVATPLPTELAGTTVTVRDSAGIEHPAPLMFVSPTQVNYLVPPETAPGTAIVTVTNDIGQSFAGTAHVETVAAGLFTANAGGVGLAAAVALRIKTDGSRHYEPLVEFDPVQNRLIARPLDLGSDGDQVFLILFGTGLRHRSNLSAVTVNIGGQAAQALYVGPQGEFAGLDQVNLRVPRSLAGRGEVDLTLAVGGKIANTVKVYLR